MIEKLKGKTVLIVDDEPMLRQIIEDEFLDIGAKTLIGESGASALEVFKNNEVDLILSDFNMPNGNGAWLLEEIKKSGKKVPLFFIISGFETSRSPHVSDPLILEVFNKPMDIDTVLATICKYL